ncbi:MAG: pectinacetylesterase family protein [Spirochaetes bacterium]|nr:pectinacetylesterase family protein [Spirochaetota bacterium]
MKYKHMLVLVIFSTIVFLIHCGESGSDSNSDTLINYWQQIDWETADDGVYSQFVYNNLSPSCSNHPAAANSKFLFFVRYGTVNKLVIYFQGGGACWHYNNCVAKPTYSEELMYYDDANILDLISNGQAKSMGYSGIFDFTNAENPFKDWNFVYIPYCTGDLHWGKQDTEYTKDGSPSATIRHRGHVNFQLVLEWLRNHFKNPDPDVIFVTGISAGSYGAIFNLPYIAEEFQDSQVHLLGDAGNGVITDEFKQNIDTLWGASLPDIGSFNQFSGYNIDNLTIADLYSTIANFYSNYRFAQYTAAWDENQVFFYNVMLNIENPGDDYKNWYNPVDSVWCQWHTNMLDILETTYSNITHNPKNYSYYIAPGDVHTILMTNEVYTLTVNGVRFVDWLGSIVEGGDTFVTIECSDCQQPGSISCN